MKEILKRSLLFVALVSTLVSTISVNAEGIELGDVNGNGTVDAGDASEILIESALRGAGQGEFDSEKEKNADLNCDSVIDAQDATFVLIYSAVAGAGAEITVQEFIYEQLPELRPTEPPTEPPIEPPTQPPTEPEPEPTIYVDPNNITYVFNTKTKKFHSPDCRDVDKIASENRQDFSGSREDAVNMGYSPCGHCKP